MDSFVLSFVRSQVDAILSEIERIEGSEFPYGHTREALNETKSLFETHKYWLSTLDDKSDPGTADLVCSTAFVDLKGSIDLLGFLLRSTNIRNAFEAYGPMLRIARKVLGEETRLVLSSEWSFSPFTFVNYEHLPNVVLIGLPATESSNPLLLPLAGHEFGHTAWKRGNLDISIEHGVEQAVIKEIADNWPKFKAIFETQEPEKIGTDLRARPVWKPAWKWAVRQCAEHFCDFFGLRIFGEAYLHAFAYLLAPHRHAKRIVIYPELKARAEALAHASKKYGLNVPDKYTSLFGDMEGLPPENHRETLLLSLADSVRAKFLDQLQSKADEIVRRSALEQRDPTEVQKCKKRLSLMVPAENSKGLANILNAAWDAWHDPDFIKDKMHNKHRLSNLREVVLKSIEILEIEFKLDTP